MYHVIESQIKDLRSAASYFIKKIEPLNKDDALNRAFDLFDNYNNVKDIKSYADEFVGIPKVLIDRIINDIRKGVIFKDELPTIHDLIVQISKRIGKDINCLGY